jgi:hypothetical protein
MRSKLYQLAEINIARARAPLENPLLADFVAQLDEVNALADRSPGFIWRLKSDGGGASSYFRAFDDEQMLINMSVWESIEALKEYVYRTHHGKVYGNRKKWFEPLDKSPLALWWIPAGELPTVEEGLRRLELLWANGPSPEAFTFKQLFPIPTEG